MSAAKFVKDWADAAYSSTAVAGRLLMLVMASMALGFYLGVNVAGKTRIVTIDDLRTELSQIDEYRQFMKAIEERGQLRR